METLILNPYYALRHDLKRSFICSKDSLIMANSPVDLDCALNWETKIHPAYAMILSFFSHGKSLDMVLAELAYFLDKDKKNVYESILPLINNSQISHVVFEGKMFIFPKNTLIAPRRELKGKEYEPNDFMYTELDFHTKRQFSMPMSITLMLNNTCSTTCEYCYADIRNRMPCQIPFERIVCLLEEASKYDVNSFDLLGGEIFLYKDWFRLLKEMKKYGYFPDLISTKTPLDKSDIEKLKEVLTPATNFQLSLDSVDSLQLEALLRVKSDYLGKIERMLHLLEDASIGVSIATTLVKRNTNLSNIDGIVDFLSKFSNISFWNIGPAFDSLYIKSFHNIKSDYKTLNAVRTYIETIKNKLNYDVAFDDSLLDKEYYKSNSSKEFKGSTCSANRHHMMILPDGNVTICEQLYWKPQFIVGNVLESSIKEVWSSERSLFFANLQRSQIQKSSECSECDIFDECYTNMNRCWAEVLKAYGDENWDFPDPRCMKAPKMLNDLNFL